MTTQEQVDLVNSLWDRAERDENFRAAAQQDPIGTMVAAGVSSETIGKIAEELARQISGEEAEVEGHCVVLSCILSTTKCKGTCKFLSL